ncbi:Oidioi.mRNA.OKI2018_I69.PAR.g9158.t1.cds [Oikopleura dioica]|uniref:Oidioi.mRNA.OKI2018_I69.PAR.g9158.t1.cds n=1 Tax=Oikopleura dioica TaxID=34765 RepID=A0ABN7RRW0_OIKDI|nr:Oidioi.mRNA.OKI2018_I69.PAR.g9158.t1.cds [Oikopleura dioica]
MMDTMKNILINPATPIVLYTAYKVLNLAKQAKRLNSFTDQHYKPSGQNFFGSFAEFIKTMRMSIEDGSISEEFLFWRQRKFKESQNSAFPGTWIFKTLPWRQLMYVADPKLVEMMAQIPASSVTQGGFAGDLLELDSRGFKNGLVMLEHDDWKKQHNLRRRNCRGADRQNLRANHQHIPKTR